MSRLVAVVIAGCVLVSGCGARLSSTERVAAVLGGLALAAGGVAVSRTGVVDGDYNGVNDTTLDDEGPWGGALLIVIGSLIAFSGATAKGEPEAAAKAAPAPIPPVVVAAPVVATAPERLPELPADEPTLRIAKQIRVAASTGRCENAWLMWRKLTVQAPEYAGAIATGPVLAPCRR